MASKSVLIVNYYFPPFQRVGGRRWAKFAKYLFRRGWDVHVVAGDFPGSVSPWDKDTELYRDRIHRVTRNPLPLPYFKQTLPKNPVQKIRWKLSQWIYESITKKKYVGDYTDPSYLDGPAFAQKVHDVLKTNPQIKLVAVTIGPYYYAMNVLKLKKQFPYVAFILDLRDVWLDWPGLTNKQLKELKVFKEEMHNLPDYFLTVSDILTNFLEEKYTQPALTIPHAIDEDDFENLPKLLPDPNKISFVYGGDLYHGSENRLTLLNELLEILHKRNFNVEATFYVDSRKHPHQKWKHLKFLKPVMLDEFFEKVLMSDFSLVVRGDITVNQFTTKIFELVKLKRPILIIDKNQPELQFIQSKGLGIALISQADLNSVADAVIEQKNRLKLPIAYNLDEHTIKHTCCQLEEYLINILNSNQMK